MAHENPYESPRSQSSIKPKQNRWRPVLANGAHLLLRLLESVVATVVAGTALSLFARIIGADFGKIWLGVQIWLGAILVGVLTWIRTK